MFSIYYFKDTTKQFDSCDLKNPQAILHFLISEEHQEKEASQCWKDFEAIRNDFLWQPIMQEEKLDDVVSDFEEFKKVVKLLKKDIKEAVEAKKT